MSDKITAGLAASYQSAKTSDERIKILSSVTLVMSNKQLKDIFKRTDRNGQIQPCNDYEITKARLHNKNYGAAADGSQKTRIVRICTSAEDVAFSIDFLHNPESVERSSYKTASCEGRKGSWISELLGGGTQPVLWLKKTKHLCINNIN